MAIAYDATSGANRSAVISDSLSHTCTGTDRLLLVWVFFDRGNGSYTASGITYAGVALSQVDTFSDGTRYAELWSLLAPTEGANTLAATYNNVGPTAKVLIRAVSYTGVHQTTPLGTLSSAYGTTNAPTVTVASATNEVVADYVWVYSGGFNIVVGADQMSRHEIDNGALGYGAHGWSDEAGASSVTMSWSIATSDSWMIGAVPIKPVGADTPSGIPKTTKQTLMGVG